MVVDRVAFYQKLQASRNIIFNSQNKNIEPLNEDLFKVLEKRDFQISELESMLNKGADPNARDEMLYTPLIIVARLGDHDAVKLLIEKGADVNAQDQYGQSVLSMASRNGSFKVVDFLIGKNAEINTLDMSGYSPLRLALGNIGLVPGCYEVAKLLIEKGADPNFHFENDSIPLSCALEKRSNDLAKLLIERGADVNARDHNGYTPLKLAQFTNDEELINFLKSKGAIE